MRGKLKRFRVPIFALSILLSLSFAYLQNDSLTEIYFLPLDLNLENIDNGAQEDRVIDPGARSKGIVSAAEMNPAFYRHSPPISFAMARYGDGVSLRG